MHYQRRRTTRMKPEMTASLSQISSRESARSKCMAQSKHALPFVVFLSMILAQLHPHNLYIQHVQEEQELYQQNLRYLRQLEQGALDPAFFSQEIPLLKSNTQQNKVITVAAKTARPSSWTLEAADPCFSIIRDFHLLSDCYRSYDGSACVSQEQWKEEQLHSTKHNGTIFVHRPEPVYNWADFPDQGFGRLIEHTTLTCIMAMNMGRACVINLSKRDEYYTFRSFLNIGTYNWNSDLADQAHEASINDAISKLDDPSAWTSPPPVYDDILPMTDFEHAGFKSHQRYQMWKQEPDKLLLSPSWGVGWFGKVDIFEQSTKQCGREAITTIFQNAMWAPTTLTKTLFSKRRQKILGGFDNETMNSHSDTHNSDNHSYAAVHIRTHFLEKGTADGTSLHSKFQIAINETIECIETFSAMDPSIQKWWILSDNPDMAENITTTMKWRQLAWKEGKGETSEESNSNGNQLYSSSVTSPQNKRIPTIHTVHGYTRSFNQRNKHSADASRALFNHNHMAPSIMDWMVLHESKLALVYKGSFARTGARGNSKVLTGKCHQLNVYAKRSITSLDGVNEVID